MAAARLRMMGPADVRVEQGHGSPVVRVRGEIDLSNAEQIKLSILECVSNQELALVVDLEGVRYLDSAGIRAFFELSRRLSEHEQELILIVPKDAVIRRSMEVGGLLRAVTIAETVEEATHRRSTR